MRQFQVLLIAVGVVCVILSPPVFAGQLNIQCYGENESPIRIRSDIKCENNLSQQFELDFTLANVNLKEASDIYHKKFVVSDTSEGQGVQLKARDTSHRLQKFVLNSVEIYTPARHRMNYRQVDSDDSKPSYKQYTPKIELVFYLRSSLVEEDSQSSTLNPQIGFAAISFLFEEIQPLKENLQGNFFLSPFATDETSLTLSLGDVYKEFDEMKKNHGYFRYYGSKIAEDCENENVSWFVFDAVLGIKTETLAYFSKKFGEYNIKEGALREIQQFNKNTIKKVGCYQQDYVQASDYKNIAFWCYLIVMALYFLSSYSRPHEKNIFSKKFKDNQMTLIPIYSIMNLEHEQYFNKNSRSTLYLLQVTCIMFVQSVLIELTSSRESSLILYIVMGLISMVVSWPICFAMGFLNSKNYATAKVILGSEIKLIEASEHSQDDEEFIKSIENSQFAAHTFTFIFYCVSILLIIIFFIVGTMITVNWISDSYVNWIIASVIGIAVDMLVDFGIAKFRIKPALFAMKGYYFDFALAELIQKNKHIKII